MRFCESNRRFRIAVMASLTAGWLASFAAAQVTPEQQQKPPVVPSASRNAEPVADVSVPLMEQPLTLADFTGMEPRPDLRRTIAQVSGFIQNSFCDGQPATEKTEVYLAHTRTALYIVFLWFDDPVSCLRGLLARRASN